MVKAFASSDPEQRAWTGGSSIVASAVIGVALGGFFDGILLHQILQWHHFLSLVPGQALRDTKNQILADGAFHVLMYAVAALGLVLLWRSRMRLADPASGTRLLGGALLGFGAWQFIDVVVFHWIVGIHRIRVDVASPLPWDIGWLVVFGLPPSLAAFWLLRRVSTSFPGPGPAMAAGLALAVIGAGQLAALPPSGSTATFVVFPTGTSARAAFGAVAAVDGHVIWADPSSQVLVIEPASDQTPWSLYRHGALLVGRTSPGGCLSWARAFN